MLPRVDWEQYPQCDLAVYVCRTDQWLLLQIVVKGIVMHGVCSCGRCENPEEKERGVARLRVSKVSYAAPAWFLSKPEGASGPFASEERTAGGVVSIME